MLNHSLSAVESLSRDLMWLAQDWTVVSTNGQRHFWHSAAYAVFALSLIAEVSGYVKSCESDCMPEDERSRIPPQDGSDGSKVAAMAFQIKVVVRNKLVNHMWKDVWKEEKKVHDYAFFLFLITLIIVLLFSLFRWIAWGGRHSLHNKSYWPKALLIRIKNSFHCSYHVPNFQRVAFAREIYFIVCF